MEDTLHALNPIFMMATSGARGSFKQIRQLAGMRGLMANPKGEIIERRIKANFMEGLSVLEYFISTPGARRALADTALRTADSGYLTRRLVDVSQDVIIREENCKTKEFVELPLFLPDGLNKSVAGRIVAEDVHKPLASGRPGKTVVAHEGEEVTMPRLREIVEELGEAAEDFSIPIRSVLKCKADSGNEDDEYSILVPRRTRLTAAHGEHVDAGDPLHEGSLNPSDLLRLKGYTETELYLVGEVQKVYKSQGVEIHDKHIELIVRQMLKKVRVENNGDAELLPGQLVDKIVLERENTRVKKAKKEQATSEPLILGITKASLATESFLSAASVQQTTKVLTDAAIEGKVDRLLGLKENVIIGKLIPAATGLKRYRT